MCAQLPGVSVQVPVLAHPVAQHDQRRRVQWLLRRLGLGRLQTRGRWQHHGVLQPHQQCHAAPEGRRWHLRTSRVWCLSSVTKSRRHTHTYIHIHSLTHTFTPYPHSRLHTFTRSHHTHTHTHAFTPARTRQAVEHEGRMGCRSLVEHTISATLQLGCSVSVRRVLTVLCPPLSWLR